MRTEDLRSNRSKDHRDERTGIQFCNRDMDELNEPSLIEPNRRIMYYTSQDFCR
jgi:hypothetical protein